MAGQFWGKRGIRPETSHAPVEVVHNCERVTHSRRYPLPCTCNNEVGKASSVHLFGVKVKGKVITP